MASEILSAPATPPRPDAEPSSMSLGDAVLWVLSPLASLKLTVALFVMAIFLILAGTVAQIDKDIWDVMSEYFRAIVARIELQVFFPRSWNVPGAIWFPGGFTIGGLMLVNLLAAHAVRFKTQAKGGRLALGALVTLVGVAITWLVIASGSNKEGFEGEPIVSWDIMWQGFKWGLVLLWMANVAGLALVGPARRIEFGGLAFLAVVLGASIGWVFWQGDDFSLDYSSMRILWQLLKATFASLVLLAGCLLIFKRRAGIVLLHGGIALMMFSELWVTLVAVESQMHIQEGQAVNYARDVRTFELAVVDASPEDHDDVVVVPKELLVAGGKSPIRHDDLPFDVRVVEFLPNSEIDEIQGGEETPATIGSGLKFKAVDRRASTGVDTGGAVDQPSAYVELIRKDNGESLGTWLLAAFFDEPALAEIPFYAPYRQQFVELDGKRYEISLRYRRHYKPYAVYLHDVVHETYPGTSTPSNYSSEIRLVDPVRNVDRDVRVWMNNPLRYAGETFYQSNYFRNPVSGAESTGLQVVTNSGWMIPYVACMIVAVGMLYQFGMALGRFVRRRESDSNKQIKDQVKAAAIQLGQRHRSNKTASQREAAGSGAGLGGWGLALLVVLVAVAYLAREFRVSKPDPAQYDLVALGKLPLLYEGRTQPLDTLARNSLRVISSTDEFVDADKNKQPAIRWLLDVMVDPVAASKHRVVKIENLEMLDMLGLQRRPGLRYAIEEFRDRMTEFERAASAARQRRSQREPLDPFDIKVLDVDDRLQVYSKLLSTFETPDLARTEPDKLGQHLLETIRRQQGFAEAREPALLIPPATPDGEWDWYGAAWTRAWATVNLGLGEVNPALVHVTKVLAAYANEKPREFNQHLREYNDWLAANPPPNYDRQVVNFEAFFNHAAPFYHCSVLYLIAFILTIVGWLVMPRSMNRAALALIVLTLLVHFVALAGRVYISGRPPVTNLYSSAVFIGFACVCAGAAFECLHRIGIGNLIASVAGFSTLLIAHFLAGSGDTIKVMQAVLDTQFWLSTHVILITLGYAATFVAGFLGIIYVLMGIGPGYLDRSIGKTGRTLGNELARMTYGTVCFALFLSFVGTVLGGLWADDSWGRFWGWDPKENGALIIVLWNALILHARWDRMIGDRGLALLAIGGNMATAWSWFGVNNLGVGLHSYGFTDGVTRALAAFFVSQLLLIALGLLAPMIIGLLQSADHQRE